MAKYMPDAYADPKSNTRLEKRRVIAANGYQNNLTIPSIIPPGMRQVKRRLQDGSLPAIFTHPPLAGRPNFRLF